MSFRNALVTQLLNDKKYTALQEYLQIEFPGKDTVMIQEYAGEVPRVFYNMDDNIMLMLPGNMNTYMENAVANAIQSGTIFDDAENVKNTAEYIRMTTLPYGGMALKGHDEPKALKSTIGSVVGAMNVDTAHFGDGENDLQNGYTAMKDMMSHANDSDMATTKLIKDYIKLKDDGKLPTEYRRTLGKVKYDVKNLEDVTCDDCITKSDYRPMKLTDECGSVCAVDEFDDTNASAEEITDDAESVVKDQTDIIDEEDNVVDSSEFEGGGLDDGSIQEGFFDLFKPKSDEDCLNKLKEMFGDVPSEPLDFIKDDKVYEYHHAKHPLGGNFNAQIQPIDSYDAMINWSNKKEVELMKRDQFIPFAKLIMYDSTRDDCAFFKSGSYDIPNDDYYTIAYHIPNGAIVFFHLSAAHKYDCPITVLEPSYRAFMNHCTRDVVDQPSDIEKESFYNTSNNHDEIYSESVFNKRPKKLKPIPRDIVAYITVEMNNIQDSNDQAMLAGYTCSKLELVDFYLNCIDTEDDRYIVPHTRQYLVQMQNDLNRLLTQILRIKPVNKMDRIWKIGVNLPG